MKKLLIWFGPYDGINSEVYGCEFYYCIYNPNSFEKFKEILPKAEEYYDAFTIHLNNHDFRILSWLIETGRTSSKYEIRIHSVDREQYKLFWNYINEHWKDQTGWFKR